MTSTKTTQEIHKNIKDETILTLGCQVVITERERERGREKGWKKKRDIGERECLQRRGAESHMSLLYILFLHYVSFKLRIFHKKIC